MFMRVRNPLNVMFVVSDSLQSPRGKITRERIQVRNLTDAMFVGKATAISGASLGM